MYPLDQDFLTQIKDFCHPLGLNMCLNITTMDNTTDTKPQIAYPVLTNADGTHIYTAALTFYETYQMKEFEQKYGVQFRLKEPKQSDLEETKVIFDPVDIDFEAHEIDLSPFMTTKPYQHLQKKDIEVKVPKSLCLMSKYRCFK